MATKTEKKKAMSVVEKKRRSDWTPNRKKTGTKNRVTLETKSVIPAEDKAEVKEVVATVNAKTINLLLASAVKNDYARELPPPAAWDDWVQAKAIYYGVKAFQIQDAVGKELEKFDKKVKSYQWEEAQSIAKALNFTRAIVLAKLGSLMEATEEVYGKDEDGVSLPIGTKPRLDIQLAAAKEFVKIQGMYAPTKIEHEVELGDRLMALTEAELALELKRNEETVGKLKIGDAIDVEFDTEDESGRYGKAKGGSK